MSVVQYDQVKIEIKQMANYQPILHVHYYYQGELVQVKFTVESAKIQKFLRAAIDEANLKKVEMNSNTVKLNYRNIGSFEIKNYSVLKNEPLFKEFDKKVVQRSAKNREKEKALSTVKNLKVNKKYKLWSKVKKTATKIGAVVLLGTTLAGAFTTLERFFPFQQNKSKVEAEGTNLEQVPATDIKHATITLNEQKENQKVKILFSQTDTPSKKTVESNTNQQEINSSVAPPVVGNTTVGTTDVSEKEIVSERKEQENTVSSTNQLKSTEEESNANWLSAQLESIQNTVSNAIGLTPSEETKTVNQETPSVKESTTGNTENVSINKESMPVNEVSLGESNEDSEKEIASATDQVMPSSINTSMETIQVPKQEEVIESKKAVVEQENNTKSSNMGTLEEHQETVAHKETKEETTSHLETTTSSADSMKQVETTDANEIDSSIVEQPTTNVPEEKETESQPSITAEETVEADASLKTTMNSQNTASSELKEVANQHEEMFPSNSSIETSPETTESSLSDALASSQSLSEIETTSLDEIPLHQEGKMQKEEEQPKEEAQQNLTNSTEISTVSEKSVTPTVLASHEEIAVNDQNTIKSGYHYTTGNTTYPMSEEDFYKLVVIINAESNKTYEDALGVASVIANRVEDGGWGGDMPLDIATAQGQFVVWQNSSVRSQASAAASSGSFDNAEVVKAARDCFFGGIRNNDYVEFKSSGSPTYSSSGEKKYQIVSGGNKYHHLAENLNRVNQNQYSSTDIATNFDQIYDSYGSNEEETNRSLSA